MIVVSIIGVLAAVAIPAFQDYPGRARVSAGLVRAGVAKVNAVDMASSGSNTTPGCQNGDTSPTASVNVSGVVLLQMLPVPSCSPILPRQVAATCFGAHRRYSVPQ
jgi:type II secretory pathway pseudopilin PulG